MTGHLGVRGGDGGCGREGGLLCPYIGSIASGHLVHELARRWHPVSGLEAGVGCRRVEMYGLDVLLAPTTVPGWTILAKLTVRRPGSCPEDHVRDPVA